MSHSFSHDELECDGTLSTTDSASDHGSDSSPRFSYHDHPLRSTDDAHTMWQQRISSYTHIDRDVDGFSGRIAARFNFPLIESSHARCNILSDTSSQDTMPSMPNSQLSSELFSNTPSLTLDNESSSMLSPSSHGDAEVVNYYQKIDNSNAGASAFGCLLGQVNCTVECPDAEVWARHSRWHFGQDEPPRTIRCPFPCRRGRIFKCADGIKTWQCLSEHVDAEHREGGRCDIQDDTLLSDYLWHRRIIDDMQYQQLQNGGLGNVSVSTQGLNYRRDKRESRLDRHR